MVVALCVSAGFRSEIYGSLSSMGGDIRIVPVNASSTGFSQSIDVDAQLDEIRALDGVCKAEPVIYRAGIVNCGEDIQGLVFKGVSDVADSSYFDEDLDAIGAVRIPRTLAEKFDISAGDRLKCYFVGERLLSRRLTVCGIYDNIVTSDDMLVAFCDLDMLCRVNGWESGSYSSVEIVLDSDDAALRACVRDAVEDAIEPAQYYNDCGLRCECLDEAYPQLFDWLRLIDGNVALILLLMIVAAGFNMIVAMLIFLFENIRNIGILKSMGMRPSAITGSFLLSVLRAVGLGMLCGDFLSIVFCYLQQRTHFIRLNPVNYFVDHVPVEIQWQAIVVLNIVSLAVIMLMVLVPCRMIAKVDPSKTVTAD